MEVVVHGSHSVEAVVVLVCKYRLVMKLEGRKMGIVRWWSSMGPTLWKQWWSWPWWSDGNGKEKEISWGIFETYGGGRPCVPLGGSSGCGGSLGGLKAVVSDLRKTAGRNGASYGSGGGFPGGDGGNEAGDEDSGTHVD